MTATDPTTTALDEQHPLGCPVWQTSGPVDDTTCTCPPDSVGADAVMSALVADLPLNAAAVQQRLTALGHHDPERAHAVEDELLRHVLRRIAHDRVPAADATALARAALVAVGGDHERWCA